MSGVEVMDGDEESLLKSRGERARRHGANSARWPVRREPHVSSRHRRCHASPAAVHSRLALDIEYMHSFYLTMLQLL